MWKYDCLLLINYVIKYIIFFIVFSVYLINRYRDILLIKLNSRFLGNIVNMSGNFKILYFCI